METFYDQQSPIYFGEGSLFFLSTFLEDCQRQGRGVYILCDSNTRLHCLPVLHKACPVSKKIPLIEIAPGEAQKNMDTLSFIWTRLLEYEADRNSVLLNLGGGVICDMGGFAASCYKRGIDFANVPTTLLSMADASVGGKTAVDFGGLKNAIGLFSRPKAIFIEANLSNTCSFREQKAAYAEIIKMYCLFCSDFKVSSFEYDQKALAFAIRHKIKLTEEDFREKGMRKYLNFGHSFGHAIESLALSKGESLLHGEAVILGMLCALFLSVRLRNFPNEKFLDAELFFQEHFPYFPVKEDDYTSFLAFLKQDKKKSNSLFSWVLLSDMGNPVLVSETEEKTLREIWKYYISLENTWRYGRSS